MLTNLAANRLLKCYVHKGIHITINTIAELQNANENIKNYTSKSFWNNKSVLITGINGFIGGNLSKHLSNLGANIIGITNNKIKNKFLNLKS